jgi:uncharacterized protein (DUF1501 family)
MLSRRQLLQRGAVAGAAALAPRRARADVPAADRKFVFVVIYRGWDPTRVFAPEFDNPDVEMEPDAAPADAGGIRFVDHPDRPSVRTFFERWHASTTVINGLIVPSVSHTECLRLALTGSNQATGADWPALLAQARADTLGLPHVVIRGPSYPGVASSVVTRVGSSGWVERVLDGSVLALGDTPIAAPPPEVTARIARQAEAWATARARTTTSARAGALFEGYASANARAETLRSLVGAVRWGADERLEAQTDLATDLLSLGLARCVTLTYESVYWDSHADNDRKQSTNFETLFSGLNYLMEQLSVTPGELAPTLAEETVLVLFSEMGRTPQFNGQAGKDHWPHTSALLCGPGLEGDRVVGGFTDYYYGDTVDLATGARSDRGVNLYPSNFGATLLSLGGVDSEESLPGASPLAGILR